MKTFSVSEFPERVGDLLREAMLENCRWLQRTGSLRLSRALERPMLSLPGHPKTERFYRQIGRAECCLSPSEWNERSLARHFAGGARHIGQDLPLSPSIAECAALNRKWTDEFVRAVLHGTAR